MIAWMKNPVALGNAPGTGISQASLKASLQTFKLVSASAVDVSLPAPGNYTLTVDVNDGLRCLPGYSMPTRDTYSWDAVTLAGTIDSVYDVGCFNGPPGTQFWTFALQRL